jgi:hypothetical protein
MAVKHPTPRTKILARIEDELLVRIDAWQGAANRVAKINALIRLGLDVHPLEGTAPAIPKAAKAVKAKPETIPATETEFGKLAKAGKLNPTRKAQAEQAAKRAAEKAQEAPRTVAASKARPKAAKPATPAEGVYAGRSTSTGKLAAAAGPTIGPVRAAPGSRLKKAKAVPA